MELEADREALALWKNLIENLISLVDGVGLSTCLSNWNIVTLHSHIHNSFILLITESVKTSSAINVQHRTAHSTDDGRDYTILNIGVGTRSETNKPHKLRYTNNNMKPTLLRCHFDANVLASIEDSIYNLLFSRNKFVSRSPIEFSDHTPSARHLKIEILLMSIIKKLRFIDFWTY